MTTLVIDTGSPRFVGILSAEDQSYSPYWQQSAHEAIERIFAADQIVTFAGDFYDLTERSDFPELGNLPINIVHIDMKDICWQARANLFGKGLREIYKLVFGSLPVCPNDYKASPYLESNWQDCYMTYRLWDLWRTGKLEMSSGIS